MTGRGSKGASYGLPRFRNASFLARFPFGTVTLADDVIPLDVEITGWSPFIPGKSDDSSLPVGALEYRFKNPTNKLIEAVFSFHSRNFMATDPRRGNSISPMTNGFVLRQQGTKEAPHEQGQFAVFVDDKQVVVDHGWFRGSHYDAFTLVWKNIQEGVLLDNPAMKGPTPGASLFVPFSVGPGSQKSICLMVAWYVPQTNLSIGQDPKDAPESEGALCCPSPYYVPWYACHFKSIREVTDYWRKNYDRLRQQSMLFRDTFYDTTLPDEVVEAVAANLTILKSPTVLRQADGRLWCFEGCNDDSGCCYGTCTHVWNYAQAIPHLFPELERTLRETEFNVSQDDRGHQVFRTNLPIRPAEPYDIEYWGPDGHCTSFYLGALAAAIEMGTALDEDVSRYRKRLEKGKTYLETKLYNGEYFYQKIMSEGLNAKFEPLNPSANGPGYKRYVTLINKQGPRYQYGTGCLSDGVLGFWIAHMCGLDGNIVDRGKIRSNLRAIYKYNLKHDLSAHANPQRPSYAMGNDGGLLLCTWPKGGQIAIPFIYSNEVWTGIEYQVASHLMLEGMVDEGLEIVRVCRDRYDGVRRNPFNEYECGHWYARALSSYGLIQGLTGVRYDAVDKVLYINSQIGDNFRCFFSCQTGFGTVSLQEGKPFVEMKLGDIDIKKVIVSGKTL